MNNPNEIKKAVREKYAEIAEGKAAVGGKVSSCCGGATGGCSSPGEVLIDMSSAYADAAREAIPDGADLGLGCGTPAAFADLREGMTVLDLGSGAGIDCFVAAKLVGASGRVIGVDMTEAMIARANENKRKVESANVEFRLGEIESLPVESGTIDRVISNCVINLIPDKEAAFREI